MITEQEFGTIADMVEKIISQQVGKKTDYFITAKVLKVDVANKCIYLEEFGDQAIPIISFNYEVTYYDQTPAGTNYGTSGTSAAFTTRAKTVDVKLKMPKVGQRVLVAREMGADRLPRCLGVILGTNWIAPEED